VYQGGVSFLTAIGARLDTLLESASNLFSRFLRPAFRLLANHPHLQPSGSKSREHQKGDIDENK